MQHQLASIVEQFETARTRVRSLWAATGPSRWGVRRRPDAWSVAECIVHLNLTARAYIPLLQDGLAHARTLPKPARRYRRDAAGWLMGFAAGPLPRIGRWRLGRVRTKGAFTPPTSAEDLAPSRVVAEFEALQDEQVALVRQSEEKALEEIWIISPFDARVRYNAYSCLVLLPRHQRRHLDQAEQVWS